MRASGVVSVSEESGYPRPSTEAAAAIAGRLVEIVSDLHPEGLTEGQLGEVRAAVAAQLAAAARLHRFPLTNGQEPVFAVRYPDGGAA